MMSPLGPQMVIGGDGNAYVLHQDFSTPSAPKTTITALAPVTSGGKTVWTATIPGVVNSVETGAGTVIVPVAFSSALLNPFVMTPFMPGKLYFLSSTDGKQVAAVDLTGSLWTLAVRTVGGTDYAYVVTRVYTATTSTLPISISSKLQLTVYKMNGTVVTTLTATGDSVREEQ